MRLVRSISRDRGLSNRYQETTNFGHYVKWDKEVEEKRAYSRLSTNQFFPGFSAYLDVISVKFIEDLKILFEAFTDVRPDDGRV
jgi:hypothetical protein